MDTLNGSLSPCSLASCKAHYNHTKRDDHFKMTKISEVAGAKEVTMEGNKVEENGRERLKRHRGEVAGRVWIPEIWGQEDFLKDWIDCSAFDASLAPAGIMSSARAALVEERRRAVSSSSGLSIRNRC